MRTESPLGKKKEEISAELWMVPYADLMTNMMILFLALFAMTLKDTATTERTIQRISQAFKGDGASASNMALRESELAVTLEDTMRGMALTDFGVRVTARYIHLSLPSPVLFPEGSATLAPSAARYLEPLGRAFRDLPNPVLVGGHTDSQRILSGPYKTNWELSAARAFSVIEFFTEQGLPPRRFQARGYGEHRPIAANDTKEGRAKNRRIELRLIREVKKSE
jgi:chemotaxis protein MotB